MTEEEAWRAIQHFQSIFAILNTEDDFEVLVYAVPIELRDEEDHPTGEWDVHTGWHCWVRAGDVPREFGRILSINSPMMTGGAIYQVLARSVADTMGTAHTFRTHEDALRGAASGLRSGDD